MIGLRNKPDIRRVGYTLVAVFDKAQPPLIWRFDLSHHHSFTLGLQDRGAAWELGVTTGQGESRAIACFPARQDAEAAFAAIGGMLAYSRLGWIYSWVKNILVLIVLFYLAAFLSLQVRHLTGPVSVATPPQAVQPAETPALNAPGPDQNDIRLPAEDGTKPPDMKP